MQVKNIIAGLSVAVVGTHAFWRMECRGRVGLGRVDPLVNPGIPAAHVHAIHGSSGFSMTAGYTDLINGECTSCAVTQDKSAYWAPSMYFQHDDGNLELVPQVGGMLAYYFLNSAPGQTGNITAFPEGFRMIAGDTSRREYNVAGLNVKLPDPEKSIWGLLGQTTQPDLAQRAIGFNCLNYGKTPEGSLYRHYLPDKAYLDEFCADGIRLELMFPSCWNGKDVDSLGHKSHVAYPDLVMNGNCPPDHPVRLPGLFFETIWDTNHFNGVPGKFVMSNGDYDGFGYHGDFIMGWPSQQFLQTAVDTCTSDTGLIGACGVFNIVDEYTQNQCKMKTPDSIASEKVSGIIGKILPGGVPFGAAPAANPASQASSSSVVGYAPGNTASVSGSYLPGDIFMTKSTEPAASSPTAIVNNAAVTSPSAPALTPAPVSSTDVDDGLAAISTQYITNGNVVEEIIWKEVVTTVTADEDTTVTVTVTPTANAHRARREAHIHQHLGRHGRPVRR